VKRQPPSNKRARAYK